MRKTVNLADRQAAMDALRKLYGQKEAMDGFEDIDRKREPGTEGISEMVKPAPGAP